MSTTVVAEREAVGGDGGLEAHELAGPAACLMLKRNDKAHFTRRTSGERKRFCRGEFPSPNFYELFNVLRNTFIFQTPSPL